MSMGSCLFRRRMLVAVIALVLVNTNGALASDLLLRWTRSPDAGGYRLYTGSQSRQYTSREDPGLLTANTIAGIVYFLVTGLEAGNRYFFAATAYNVTGESDYSNEREVLVDPADAPQVTAGPDRIGVVGQEFWFGGPSRLGVNYVWLQLAGPPVSLVNRTSSAASFVANEPGTFEFLIVAYSGRGIASTDSVRITVAALPLVIPSPSVTVSATPTAAATWTPHLTPTPSTFCAAGSRSNAVVTVADLIEAVNIALGLVPFDACPALDFDGDGMITAGDLLTAMNAALNGLPP